MVHLLRAGGPTIGAEIFAKLDGTIREALNKLPGGPLHDDIYIKIICYVYVSSMRLSHIDDRRVYTFHLVRSLRSRVDVLTKQPPRTANENVDANPPCIRKLVVA